MQVTQRIFKQGVEQLQAAKAQAELDDAQQQIRRARDEALAVARESSITYGKFSRVLYEEEEEQKTTAFYGLLRLHE